MFDPDQLNQFKTKLKDSASILILLPPEPDVDSLSAALSLHLTLKNSGKTSTVGCSTPAKVASSHLFGINQLKTSIGNRNLVISFDYLEDSAENVSYDIDENTRKFNLRIKPKAGSAPLDTSSISYSYTGAEADLVITLNINSLEELGRLYSEEKEFLDQSTIANISLVSSSTGFASINLNSDKFSCLSELVAFLLKSVGTSPTADAATNLYGQILSVVNNFQSSKITPDTLETAAFLLRSGAQTPKSKEQLSNPTPPPFFSTPPTTSQNKSNQPQGDSVTPPLTQATSPQPVATGVPSDWTGPKIYRGSSLK